jgi:NADH:ubiquinone oxidoreductase subunit 6 (subunit J)
MIEVQHMADVLFLALSVLTIGAAIAALELRSLIYGSIALMGTLGGIAGFFILLDSPFVAMFQIAVYVGSIAVLILFTVMLVKRELIFKKIEDPKRKLAGIGLMLIIMVAVGAIILDSGVKTITTDSAPVDFREIGEDFLTYYWPALIAMALILAGSVIGALVLARREDTVENGQRTD